jgi:hypothetical protein
VKKRPRAQRLLSESVAQAIVAIARKLSVRAFEARAARALWHPAPLRTEIGLDGHPALILSFSAER